MKRLSIVASLAIAGALSLSIVGCGSSSGSTATTTTAPVVNSYLVKLITPATDDKGNTSTTIVLDDQNHTTGKIKFDSFVSGTITVPADAFIDADADGVFSTGDKPVGFALKGKITDTAITPLTTLAIANDITLPAQLQGDPIAKMKDGDPAAYLAEQAIIKAVQANKGDVSVLNTISVKDDGAVETNSTDAAVQNAVQIASASAITLVKAAIQEKAIDPTEVIKAAEDTTLISKVADAIAENNITVDVNDTAITDLKTAESTLANTIDNLPAKLLPGSITVGDTTALLNGDTFKATVNTSDKNITDFYNISFTLATSKQTFSDVNNVGVTVTIKDQSSDKEVSMTIQGATISSDGNYGVKVELPAGSTISVSQKDLPALQSIIGDSATATTTKDLTMSDLAFNVNTVLGAIDNSKINDAINALNEYISQPKTYDVTIAFTGITADTPIVSDFTTFNGTVTVEQADSSSSEASSESSSEAATDPFANYTTQAVDNTNHAIETTVGDYTVKVYASKAPTSETSNGTIAIYGTVNGTNTGAALKLNENYSEDTKFVVKVYDADGNIVAESDELPFNASAINFGDLTTS